MTYRISIRFGVSRAAATRGYTTCTLLEGKRKRASCNGGGYDLKGTVLGDWIASTFPDRLRALRQEFYGLTFADPNFDPGKAIVPGTTQTVEEREKAGESLGLERYQAFHGRTSKLPSEKHTLVCLDGACGFESMVRVLEGIGGKIVCTYPGKNTDEYIVTFEDEPEPEPTNTKGEPMFHLFLIFDQYADERRPVQIRDGGWHLGEHTETAFDRLILNSCAAAIAHFFSRARTKTADTYILVPCEDQERGAGTCTRCHHRVNAS